MLLGGGGGFGLVVAVNVRALVVPAKEYDDSVQNDVNDAVNLGLEEVPEAFDGFQCAENHQDGIAVNREHLAPLLVVESKDNKVLPLPSIFLYQGLGVELTMQN